MNKTTNEELTSDPAIVSSPPRPKVDKVDNAIVNKQDDNSYEEPVTDNTIKQKEDNKQVDTKTDFEYTESGEFENENHLEDTNSHDDFL
ncbi:MAG: hypothetical protein V4717_06385 [Bacteroidota bacterium]